MINDRPRITGDDVRSLLWLIAFGLVLLAITAVDPTGQAAPR